MRSDEFYEALGWAEKEKEIIILKDGEEIAIERLDIEGEKLHIIPKSRKVGRPKKHPEEE